MRPYLLISALVVLSACQRDRIESYTIPKPVEPVAVAGAESSGAAGIQWKLPVSWLVQPVADMRVGSFRIPGANGQAAEVSVIPLSGEAGGNLANVNRWRQQIQLAPWSAQQLEKEAKTVTYDSVKMLYVDFVSSQPLIDNKFRKRIIAAICVRGDRTWFFKLAGDDATVRSAEAGFIQFLKSVKFKSS